MGWFFHLDAAFTQVHKTFSAVFAPLPLQPLILSTHSQSSFCATGLVHFFRSVLTVMSRHMASNATPFKPSAPVPGRPFKIFHDKGSLETPCRFAAPQPDAVFDDPNNENLNPSQNNRSRPIFMFVNKPSAQPDPTSTIKRTPLADVTQEQVGRPRSFSAALAEIARLKDELELFKEENSELKGAIVAYQDALNTAGVDAGYF